MSEFQLHCGDALSVLTTLTSESVDCCVTSPPYFGLRQYGTEPQVWSGREDCSHAWGDEIPGINRGGSGTPTNKNNRGEGYGRDASRGYSCMECGAWMGELGLEPSPQLYVDHLVEVFREVRRVLKPQGTVFLNLGDSYAGSWGNQGRKEERGTQRPINGPMIQNLKPYPTKQSNTGKIPEDSGLKPKDLIGIQWMTAFALRSDGWWLRSEVIWHKLAPMPESVEDRPTKAHEQIFLLSKRQDYFYDFEAIREPAVKGASGSNFHQGKTAVHQLGRSSAKERDEDGKRNKRSVWSVAPEPSPDPHYAQMPTKLVEPCILAGCPESGTVLDPFCGSGTVGAVALLHKRNFIGIDLNPDYIQMARRRLYQASSPLLGDVEVSVAG